MDNKSEFDRVRLELELLKVKHEALLKSYRAFVLKILGDDPSSADFLNEIQSYVIENYPEGMK